MAVGSVAAALITPLPRFDGLARLSSATSRLPRLNVEFAALSAVRLSRNYSCPHLPSYDQKLDSHVRSGPCLRSSETFLHVCVAWDRRLDNS